MSDEMKYIAKEAAEHHEVMEALAGLAKTNEKAATLYERVEKKYNAVCSIGRTFHDRNAFDKELAKAIAAR